nr:hypothetical protein [Wolbachia endosymbiont (group A) of Scambus nigricans]
MLLACYSHKHISYRIRTIIRKAILLHSAGPIFDMLPCRSTSPEEYCLGVNPIYPSCGLANEVKLRNAAAV